MDFKFRAVDEEAHKYHRPSPSPSGLSFFSEQALREYPLTDYGRHMELFRNSVTSRDVCGEPTKERIREERNDKYKSPSVIIPTEPEKQQISGDRTDCVRSNELFRNAPNFREAIQNEFNAARFSEEIVRYGHTTGLYQIPSNYAGTEYGRHMEPFRNSITSREVCRELTKERIGEERDDKFKSPIEIIPTEPEKQHISGDRTDCVRSNELFRSAPNFREAIQNDFNAARISEEIVRYGHTTGLYQNPPSNYGSPAGLFRNHPSHIRDMVIQREVEKERIREEILAEELARRRILEAEVRRELLMEREMELLRRGGNSLHYALPSSSALGNSLHYALPSSSALGNSLHSVTPSSSALGNSFHYAAPSSSALQLKPRVSNLSLSEDTLFEERVALSMVGGDWRHRSIEGCLTLPFQHNVEPKISDVQPLSQIRKENSITLISDVQPLSQIRKENPITLAKFDGSLSGVKRKAVTLPAAAAAGSELPLVGLKKKSKIEEWSCALCQVTATTEEGLNEHLRGKRHKSREARLKTGKNFTIGFPTKICKNNKLEEKRDNPEEEPLPLVKIAQKKPKKANAENMKSSNENLLQVSRNAAKMGTSDEQALRNKMEQNKKLMFWCTMCQVGAHSQKVLNHHKKGKKHLARLEEIEKKIGFKPAAAQIPEAVGKGTDAQVVAAEDENLARIKNSVKKFVKKMRKKHAAAAQIPEAVEKGKLAQVVVVKDKNFARLEELEKEIRTKRALVVVAEEKARLEKLEKTIRTKPVAAQIPKAVEKEKHAQVVVAEDKNEDISRAFAEDKNEEISRDIAEDENQEISGDVAENKSQESSRDVAIVKNEEIFGEVGQDAGKVEISEKNNKTKPIPEAVEKEKHAQVVVAEDKNEDISQAFSEDKKEEISRDVAIVKNEEISGDVGRDASKMESENSQQQQKSS